MPRVDKDEARRLAAGRWFDIISTKGGIPPDRLDGRNHSCVKCGGTDRFSAPRASFRDHGRIICRHCKPTCSDGFDTLMWATGCSFPEALQMVAEFVGLAPANTNGYRSHAGHAYNGNGHCNGTSANGQATETRANDPQVASVQVRDAAYRAILESLELADDHRQALLDRGFSDAAIAKAGYKTLPVPNDPDRIAARDAAKQAAGEEWASVPGVAALGAEFVGRGLLIPCRDCKGDVVGLRTRPDDQGTGGKYRYLSSGSPKHPPTPHVSILAKANGTVRISEGELKADLSTQLSGVPTVSIPGVGNWRTVVPIVDEVKPASILLAFDADCRTNKAVARAMIESYGELAAKGYKCSIERFSEGKGIDDALVAGAEIEVLSGADADAHLQEIAQSAGVEIDKFAASQGADPLAPVPSFAPWRAIEPFEENELPPFPTECLPGVFGEFVEAVANATQVPSEMAAILALATGAAAISKKVEVQGPNWTEGTNLYVCGIMSPGNRKSQIFRETTAPLRAIEREEIAKVAKEIGEERSARRLSVNRLRALEAGKKKLTDAEELERKQLVKDLDNWPEPVEPALIADDITSEELIRQLAAQGGRFAVMAPEGSAFDLMLGKYSANGSIDIGVYLNGHCGDDIRQSRVSRASVFVENPAITCAFTIQPDVMQALAENKSTRGRGLQGRFMWAMPASKIGKRDVRPDPVPWNVQAGYDNTIRAMYALSPRKLGFGREADKILLVWQKEVEGMCDEGGQTESLQDWAGKLVGLTLRIAGILHCASGSEDGEIEPETLRNAITIGRWAISHATAVLVGGEWIDGENTAAAKRFLRWITKEKLREFTKRDLQQQHKRCSDFDAVEKLMPGLKVLAERGFIRRRQIVAKQGRPPEVFDVNPLVFAKAGSKPKAEPDDALPDEVLSAIGETGEAWEYNANEEWGDFR
jgi:replicative DNA helicase